MKKYILLASAVVALAACSSNEEFDQTEKCEIKLSSALLIQTRAALEIQSEAFDKGEKVDVFINEDTEGSASTSYTQPLTYTVGNNSGALTITTPQYFPQNGNGVKIVAVYPSEVAGKDVNATNVEFSIETEQGDSTGYKKSDIMYGTPPDGATVYKTTSSVQLKFSHCMSKINIFVKAGDGLTNQDLQNATVTIMGTTTQASFNVKTGTVTAQKGEAATSITAGTLDVKEGNIVGISAIVVPQVVAAGTQFISIKFGGDQQTAPTELIYTLPLANDILFDAGNAYTYNITAKKSGLTVDSTSINDWKDGGSTDGEANVVP